MTNELTEKYRGGCYDRLSDNSKVFTATAWDQYPSLSFENLIEKTKTLNIEWANLIACKGVNYLVLAAGDLFCASGFASSDEIACDTEEWYASIGKACFEATSKSEDFDNEWQELLSLIDDFGYGVCQEVLASINRAKINKA